jgi:predicted RNA-binding protein YlxR (DUF448 family)
MSLSKPKKDDGVTPRTHAEASRQRRDIVSGEVMDEHALVRFVAGPDGVVYPDVSRKLPGRGIWVAANRAAVDAAVKKNAFSRSAKQTLKPAADLADQVEAQLRGRVLSSLGLARKAGDLTWGFDRVSAVIATGKAAWMIEASDGAEDGRRKLLGLARHQSPPPRLLGAFDSGELGLALGLDNVIHLAFLAGRGAGRWSAEVDRLAGFRPLLPESWREEP